MSSAADASPSRDGHDHHLVHGHDQAHGPSHGSFSSYVTGFVLSVILTAIPFWLVMGKVVADHRMTTLIILAFAAVQIVVHMIYFLHMNTQSEGGWNMLALIFTIVLVVITLTGSLWVMYHMTTNMRPPSANEMRNIP